MRISFVKRSARSSLGDYRAHLAAGGEGILTRACRELVEMGLATQPPSIVTGMTEDEKREYRATVYREVSGA